MRYPDRQEFNFEKRKHPVIKQTQRTGPKGMPVETQWKTTHNCQPNQYLSSLYSAEWSVRTDGLSFIARTHYASTFTPAGIEGFSIRRLCWSMVDPWKKKGKKKGREYFT